MAFPSRETPLGPGAKKDGCFRRLEKIWQEEVVSADWKMGYLVKLPKKGDRRDCGNSKGIMLLSVPGKVLYRVILERMRTAVHDKLRDNQAVKCFFFFMITEANKLYTCITRCW